MSVARERVTGGGDGVERVCGACSTTGFDFKACSGCKKEFYCGKPCQKSHWKKVHKKTCCTAAPSAPTTSSAAGSSSVCSSSDAAVHPASSKTTEESLDVSSSSSSAAAAAAEEEKTAAGMGVEAAGAKCNDDERRLFRGIDAKEEKRIGKRSSNNRYDHCSGCGERRSEDRPLRRCSRCNSVWYCSRACQERNWREPPWGKAAGMVVSWATLQSIDARVGATVDGYCRCIARHKDVCPLLKELCTDLKEHEAIMRRGTYRGSKSALAYAALGQTAHGRGQLGKAIKSYREAIRLDPDGNAHYHHALGLSLNDNGEFLEALGAFREAIRLDDGDADFHNCVGMALRYHRSAIGPQSDRHRDRDFRSEDEIKAYREAIRLRPDDAIFHDNVGSALHANGEFGEAIEAYREAVRLNEGEASYHYNLGKALSKNDELDKAIEALSEAIRLDPTDPRPHFDIANARMQKNEFHEGVGSFREAVRLGPRDVKHLLALAAAHASMENHPAITSMVGARDETIASLSALLEIDHSCADRALHGSMFAHLRNDPRFQALIAAARAKK